MCVKATNKLNKENGKYFQLSRFISSKLEKFLISLFLLLNSIHEILIYET